MPNLSQVQAQRGSQGNKQTNKRETNWGETLKQET